jgi:hypothetical protein
MRAALSSSSSAAVTAMNARLIGHVEHCLDPSNVDFGHACLHGCE